MTLYRATVNGPVEMTPEEEATFLAEQEAAANAPPPVPELIDMGKAKLEMLATPWPPVNPTTTLWAEVKTLAEQDESLAIELSRPHMSRTRDKTLQLKTYFGISDADFDAMWLRADARP